MELFNRVLRDVVDLTEVARLNGFDMIVQDLENIAGRLRSVRSDDRLYATCELCRAALKCQCEWASL